MASKKFKNAFISAAIGCYRFLTGNKLCGASEYNAERVKSIAIFSTTALGDLILNTPAILAIKERYPDAALTLISSHKNKALVENSPWFENIIYWDQKVKNVSSVARRLRACKPDVAVLLHSKSPYDVLCAALAKIPFVLKDAYNGSDLAMRKQVTSMPGNNFPGHLIERKLALVNLMGCSTENIQMQIPYPVKNISTSPDKVVVGFQLGASEKLRQWPVEYFRELAKLLLAAGNNFEIALIGSPAERGLAEAFLDGFSDQELGRINDYVGKCSLTGLVECIAGFDVLVTPDTGPLHLAVALKVKTVSLFVTANPAHTGPLQDPERHIVIKESPMQAMELAEYPDQPMAIIKPERVLTAVQRVVTAEEM